VTTIVLADDNQFVRDSVHALLEAEPGLRVIGKAGDGLEATRLVERLHPDVLVLDLMMPGMNGLEVARRVAEHSPKTTIVILSMYGNESYVAEALQAGAKAYVLKESTASELVRAVQEAAAGRAYLAPPLSREAIDAYVRRTKATEVGT
jgi:two-component system response regulator NreC